jgi:hypothetical protein
MITRLMCWLILHHHLFEDVDMWGRPMHYNCCG